VCVCVCVNVHVCNLQVDKLRTAKEDLLRLALLLASKSIILCFLNTLSHKLRRLRVESKVFREQTAIMEKQVQYMCCCALLL